MIKHLLLLCLFFASLMSNFTLKAEQLHLAVASNFAITMKALAQQFEQQSQHRVTISYASSGKLYAQIVHGAPYDVFLSADTDKISRLAQQNKIVTESDYIYAYGALALWRAKSASTPVLQQLKQNQFNKLAMANDKFAPYGVAAQQVLAHLAIRLPPTKIVKAENIGQSYQYIRTGNVDLGFVALSQIKQNKAIAARDFWQVPNELHQPIAQQMAILSSTKKREAAQEFLAFFRGDKAKAIIESYGYQTK